MIDLGAHGWCDHGEVIIRPVAPRDGNKKHLLLRWLCSWAEFGVNGLDYRCCIRIHRETR